MLEASLKFCFQKRGLGSFRMLNPYGRGLAEDYNQEVCGAGAEDDRGEPRNAA